MNGDGFSSRFTLPAPRVKWVDHYVVAAPGSRISLGALCSAPFSRQDMGLTEVFNGESADSKTFLPKRDLFQCLRSSSNGLIECDLQEPGTYVFRYFPRDLSSTCTLQLTVIAAGGLADKKIAIGKGVAGCDVRPATPLSIRSCKEHQGALQIGLAGLSASTRVHVVTRRFYDSQSGLGTVSVWQTYKCCLAKINAYDGVHSL